VRWIARYLTHPQVSVDSATAVPKWSLNEIGQRRVTTLANNLGVLSRTSRVVSSDETKALETAEPIATALGVTVQVRPEMHENDRSATGFLPPEVFERVADQFFSDPSCSVRGWEKAFDAQRRIVNEVENCLAGSVNGDVLFVGHGGVGTLLFCSLSGFGIDRKYDQGPGGGGCWFDFDILTRRPIGGWRPLETLMA
jgi:broad specificity phosphatase PhoE